MKCRLSFAAGSARSPFRIRSLGVECAVHRDLKPRKAWGWGAGQSSWSGRPPKARPKKPRGRCPACRGPSALQRLAGVQVRSRWGQVHPPAPERSLSYLALSREVRVTHHPGVPAPRLPAVLGHSSGSRSLPRHAGSGRQLHRVPLLPGQVRAGGAHGEGRFSSKPILEAPPGKEYTFLSTLLRVVPDGQEKAGAQSPDLCRPPWLCKREVSSTHVSPPRSATRRFVKRTVKLCICIVQGEGYWSWCPVCFLATENQHVTSVSAVPK